MEEKIIYENNNEILILQICEILKENGIPFIRRDEGAGSFLNTSFGNNVFTKRIYVSDSDFIKAEELLNFLNEEAQDIEEFELPEELQELDEEENYDIQEFEFTEELNNSEVNNECIRKETNIYNTIKQILFFWIPFGLLLYFLFR